MKSTRKTPLQGIRGRARVRIRIGAGRIALVQSPMGTNTCTSDIDTINKDIDMFTTDTDNNSRYLNDSEARRQKQIKRERKASKKKADSRFV